MINRFDKSEKALLALINCGANESYESLRKRLKVTKSKIFRAVRKAERFSLLGPTQPFINYPQLGLNNYWVYVNFGCKSQTVLKKLKERILSTGSITSAHMTAGRYHLLLILTLPSPALVNKELDQILALEGLSHADFSILTQVKSIFFGRRYLAPQIDLGAPCETSISNHFEELSAIEKEMLVTMLAHETINASELAKHLGISPSSAIRCMHSLEKRNIINGYVRDLDTNTLSLQRFSLILRASGSPSTLVKKLTRFFYEQKSIVAVTEFIGAQHIDVQCEVESSIEIPSITQEMFHLGGESIRDIEVVPVISTLKFRTFPIM